MSKILMVTERYLPVWGGAENQLRQLIPYLVEAGHSVTIVTRRWRRNMAKSERIDGVPLVRLGIPGANPIATLVFVFHLFVYLLLSGRRYDCYHSHGVVKMGVLCRIGTWVTGAKNVAKIATAGKVKPLQEKALGRLMLKIFKQSDAVVCMTEEIRRELELVGLEEQRVACIPNGVDCNKFRRENDEEKRQLFRRNLGMPESAKVVLFTGRLVRRKGVDILVEAWGQLEKSTTGLYLLILGSGTDQDDSVEAELKKLKNTLGLNRLIFLGASDSPELFLANSDIFVFPSRQEGFPNALMEAMAAELAVIVTRIGGNVDLVDENENGFFFEKDNVQELIVCVKNNYLNNGELRRIGLAARKKMMETYSFDFVSGYYGVLYHKILHRD